MKILLIVAALIVAGTNSVNASSCPDFVKSYEPTKQCASNEYYRGGSCHAITSSNWPPSEFRIGGSFPWSGGGWDVGHWIKAAYNIAIEAIEDDPLLLNQTKIVADFKTAERNGFYGPITENTDDQCSKVEATNAVVKQMLEHSDIRAFLGSGCSGSCMPGSQIAGAGEMPYISWGCSSNMLSDKASYPWFIRLEAPESANIDLWFAVMRENNWKKIAAIRNDAAIYVDVADYLVKNIASSIPNGTVVRVESFKQNELTVESAKKLLERIVETGVKIITPMMYRQDFNMIMAAADQMGLLDAGYVFLSIWPMPGEVAEIGTTDKALFPYSVKEELKFSTGVFAWYTQSFTSAALTEFTNRVENEIGASMMGWTPRAYDAMFTLAHAVQRLINKRIYPEKEALRNEWWCNTNHDGLIGKLRFNEKGDLDVVKQLVQQLPDGTLKVVYTLVNGILQKSTHDWDIWRTSDGNPPKDTMDFPSDETGTACSYEANTGRVVVDYASRTVNAECTIVAHNKNLLADTSLVTLGSICVQVNFAFAAIAIAWTLLRRELTIVRYAQPAFLVMLALGCMVSTSTILFLGAEDAGDEDEDSSSASTACMMQPWMYSIGFMLTFAPLFTKLHKVKTVFTATKSLKVVKVPFSRMLLVILGLVLLDSIVLLLWTVNDPLEYERKILAVDSWSGNTIESTGICASKNGTEFNYLGPIIGIHFIVLLYGNILAYQTRTYSGAFSESKYIAITMVSNLQVLAVGLPVLIIVADSVTSNYLVRTMVIFLNDFTVMALIFIPKMCDVELGTKFLGDGNSYLSTSKRASVTATGTATNTGASTM